jgi:methionine--tRNA ligase beta chain
LRCMAEIEFQDFEKLDMQVGKVVKVEDVPRTKKLYKMQVDLKDKQVQIVSSLKDYYEKEELEGKLIIVLTNLKPATFSGEKSEGMLLCAEQGDHCVLLTPEKYIEPGAPIT